MALCLLFYHIYKSLWRRFKKRPHRLSRPAALDTLVLFKLLKVMFSETVTRLKESNFVTMKSSNPPKTGLLIFNRMRRFLIGNPKDFKVFQTSFDFPMDSFNLFFFKKSYWKPSFKHLSSFFYIVPYRCVIYILKILKLFSTKCLRIMFYSCSFNRYTL